MGQRSIYNSTHKPQRSLNETLGFNHDGHLHRMCNETGIPEFLEFQIPGIPTTHPVENDTLDLYREGATLYKFIHEGRPTTTKRLSLLFEPSDETIRRLYGLPSNKNYIDDP